MVVVDHYLDTVDSYGPMGKTAAATTMVDLRALLGVPGDGPNKSA